MIKRLSFEGVQGFPEVTDRNRATRDAILCQHSQGKVNPRRTRDIFGGQNDIVVADVERYGLPLTTVLCCDTGLMRSDPYYDTSFLETFYTRDYRPLYSSSISTGQIFAMQVAAGDRICREFRKLRDSDSRISVLDIGCGMGGMLIPFRVNGDDTVGLDYGEEYLRIGRRFSLNLQAGNIFEARFEKTFDLVICSHVLEHLLDPAAFLNRLHEIVAEDGMLYIEVPGILNIRNTYNRDLLQYLQNAHIYHFCRETLGQLLEQCGWSAVAIDESVCCFARRSKADENRAFKACADTARSVRRALKTNEWFFNRPTVKFWFDHIYLASALVRRSLAAANK